jgi:hypothetical protein
MRYYLVVTGKGKDRRILTYCNTPRSATQMCSCAIYDHGYDDARVVTTSIAPPKSLYFKPIEPAT